MADGDGVDSEHIAVEVGADGGPHLADVAAFVDGRAQYRRHRRQQLVPVSRPPAGDDRAGAVDGNGELPEWRGNGGEQGT